MGETVYEYRINIAHALCQLQYQQSSCLYGDISIVDLINKLLGQKGIHFDTRRLSQNYSKTVIFHQYQESEFNFLSRHLERYGIYYYLERQNGKECLVFVDNKNFHPQSQNELLVNDKINFHEGIKRLKKLIERQ
ncbi:hypothetical protein BGC07_10915 [Piscirickettsia litoralis]|uniref:Type VI secretion system tip protein VgrG n=1 Tax=Piscirickettsia litoralis TaxID=1891921 RepID=A0ABX3A534_9GAMM|nr:hypothetical protein BGC07_10915 [Piscirickettsia litoralis]